MLNIFSVIPNYIERSTSQTYFPLKFSKECLLFFYFPKNALPCHPCVHLDMGISVQDTIYRTHIARAAQLEINHRPLTGKTDLGKPLITWWPAQPVTWPPVMWDPPDAPNEEADPFLVVARTCTCGKSRDQRLQFFIGDRTGGSSP